VSNGAINFNEDDIEYYTPKSLVDMFGKFDYDPATTEEQAKRLGIPNYDTIDTDGLKADWTKYKRIWINPPFNIKHLFWEKACETYFKCRKEIYFLCPISFITTKKFHDSLDKRGLNFHIALPNGRIKFINNEGKCDKSPAFGSVIVTPTGDMEAMIWRFKLP
jgi:hypothetical protein